jgi:NitT/TauT family transport system substrate-binding protein
MNNGRGVAFKLGIYLLFLSILVINGCSGSSSSTAEKKVIRISIGTQDQCINTITGGAIIRERNLLEKALPRTGKYENVEYKIEWSNFTSGPPITNKMLANQIDIGIMADFPSTINITTFLKKGEGVKTQYIATLGYSPVGAGNGVVVPKDSPYNSLADLKGKEISVPFGSAAHGMLLKVLREQGIDPEKDVKLTSQSPEVGGSSLQANQIAAHADFIPFAELFPFRGFARKIFDGAYTGVPTFHGVLVRSDFAEKYPEVVVAYLKTVLEVNKLFRERPEEFASDVQKWTGVEKEVVYLFLGPSGLQKIDPTIRSVHLDAFRNSVNTLKQLGKLDADINPEDVSKWVNDSYLRKAIDEAGLKYDDLIAEADNFVIKGNDALTNQPITNPKIAAQAWIKNENRVLNFASITNLFNYLSKLKAEGKDTSATFVHDHNSGLKLFGDKSYFVKKDNELAAFLRKDEAERFASEARSQIATFTEIQANYTNNNAVISQNR